MTKYRDRMIAQGKETASMKSTRLRKEKQMEQEQIKQTILDQIKKEDVEKRGKFDRILRMANDYTPDQLIDMIGQSMLPYMSQDLSLELLFAYTISFAIKMEKEIEEIKQCLKDKQDKFKITTPNPFEHLDKFSIREEKKDE